jgi:hypothetical protein
MEVDMSENKIQPEIEENENNSPQAAESTDGVRLAVKRKRFKKFDVLVFGVCIVASVLIWMYASNLQKKAAEKEISKDDILSKDDIVEVVESGMNKATETATDIAE